MFNNGDNDKNPHSGIQVWSRFTINTLEDCFQQGYSHGSNAMKYDSSEALEKHGMNGADNYGDGYFSGSKDFRPFTDYGYYNPHMFQQILHLLK